MSLPGKKPKQGCSLCVIIWKEAQTGPYVVCYYLGRSPNRAVRCVSLPGQKPKQGSPLPSLKGFPGSASYLKRATSPCHFVCMSACRCCTAARNPLPAAIKPLPHGDPSGHVVRLVLAPDEAVCFLSWEQVRSPPKRLGIWESCSCE
jgi:hypothetical protein